MARRHVYDRMMEENSSGIVSFEEARRKIATEGFEAVKDAFKKNYTQKQKILLVVHWIWRILNWLIITWLANQAFSKALNLLQVSRVGRPKFIFLLASIGFSAFMVRLAEGTDHDKFRTKGGQIIAIVSEAIMLFPVLIDTVLILGMDLINAVTSKIGGEIFNVENYKNSNLGALWTINLVLAVVVCISLLWEEQSTDKRLGFARTPQKKDIIDLGRAVDDDGNPVIRVKKYKQ